MQEKPESHLSVLVTGSSTGIGEACTLALHAQGFRVFAGVRRQEDGQRLVAQTSPRVIPLMLDVTDSTAIQSAAQVVAMRTGGSGLAGLVNNAGVTVAFPLEFLPVSELRRQIEINLLGPAAVTQAMLPMLRTARGRIINISSVSGLIAAPYLGAYTASKHALEALTDSLRMEVGQFGISVSLIEPADVDTPIWKKSMEASNELRDRMMADNEGPTVPEEVRNAYAADIAGMREMAVKSAARAIPVSRVVKAVLHALQARRPKTRYPVGAKTWAVRLLLRHLPDRLRDRIIRHSLNMK